MPKNYNSQSYTITSRAVNNEPKICPKTAIRKAIQSLPQQLIMNQKSAQNNSNSQSYTITSTTKNLPKIIAIRKAQMCCYNTSYHISVMSKWHEAETKLLISVKRKKAIWECC